MSSIELLTEKPRRSLRSGLRRIMDLANYDFCPSYNDYLRWLWKPVGWVTLALLASILLATFVSPQCWALVACFSAVLGLGLAWPAIAVRSLNVRWESDRATCQEGDTITIRLHVQNRMPWPVFGLAVDPLGGDVTLTRPSSALVSLAVVKPLSESVFTFERVMERRGVYPVGVPVLRCGFPFGLWQASRALDRVAPIIVTPWTTHLRVSGVAGATSIGGASIAAERQGRVGQVSGYRSWLPEDSFRDIDWVQSARRPHLVSRQRQASERPSVAIAIQSNEFGDWDDQTREVAMRWLASVVTSLQRNDWQVFVACDGQWQSLSPGLEAARRWLERMAHLKPEQFFKPLPEAKLPTALNWVFDLTERAENSVRRSAILKFRRIDLSEPLKTLFEANREMTGEVAWPRQALSFETHREAFESAWRDHERGERYAAS